MVDIRPQDLNPAVTPIDADSPIIIDQGLAGVNRTTSTAMVNAVAPVASQAEAEVGTNDVKRMTALKTKQSIASEVGVSVASYAAGQAGLSAVQPSRQVIAGAGTVGGGDLSADRTIALSPASISSLAKADTSVQPAITITAGTGLTGGGNLTANRTVALNAASIASLAKADSAIQAPGGSTGQILAKNSATTNDVGWISSEAATAVSYGPQTLTAPQKTQARGNIDALGLLEKAADSTLLDGNTIAQLWGAMGGGGGSGWRKLPGGGIIQWGTSSGTTDANGYLNINLPTSFSSASSYNLVAWNGSHGAPMIPSNYRNSPSGPPYAGAVTFLIRNYGGAVSASTTVRVDWIAIGT